MFDKDASNIDTNGDNDGNIALTYITGTGLTRKVPTVAVYQTVINY